MENCITESIIIEKWQMEKLLIMSNFSFSQIFSKVVCCRCVKMHLQVGKICCKVSECKNAQGNNKSYLPICQISGRVQIYPSASQYPDKTHVCQNNICTKVNVVKWYIDINQLKPFPQIDAFWRLRRSWFSPFVTMFSTLFNDFTFIKR